MAPYLNTRAMAMGNALAIAIMFFQAMAVAVIKSVIVLLTKIDDQTFKIFRKFRFYLIN